MQYSYHAKTKIIIVAQFIINSSPILLIAAILFDKNCDESRKSPYSVHSFNYYLKGSVSEICLRIARGWVRERRVQRSLYN